MLIHSSSSCHATSDSLPVRSGGANRVKKLFGFGGRSVKTCDSSAAKLVKISEKARRWFAAGDEVSLEASESSMPVRHYIALVSAECGLKAVQTDRR